MIPVAALYVETNGPYPLICREWFDKDRDARNYRGPLPVVAHPPCETWGKLKGHSTADTHDLAYHAVEAVRIFGGVLEHPLGSDLFSELALPAPESMFADAFGGRSYIVAQGDYGHRAPKLTLLYAVRLAACPFRSVEFHGDPGGRVELLSRFQRKATPPRFAQDLATWAATARDAA